MSINNYKTGARRRAIAKGHTDDALLDKLDALLIVSDVFDAEHMAELLAIYFGNKIFHNSCGVKQLSEELKRLQLEDRATQLKELVDKITPSDVTMSKKHNGGRMHKFSVPRGITKDKAIELQTALGYHPLGYGFYSFDATKSLTTWTCSDSCD